jgi:hypothetical protein
MPPVDEALFHEICSCLRASHVGHRTSECRVCRISTLLPSALGLHVYVPACQQIPQCGWHTMSASGLKRFCDKSSLVCQPCVQQWVSGSRAASICARPFLAE